MMIGKAGAAPLLLMADDVAACRLALGGLLSASGCEVDAVADGSEALDAAARRDDDLILLDVQMPVMGGLEAAGRLRRLRPGAPTRIVALTADPDAEGLAGSVAAGTLDAMLPKPVRAGEIRAMLARWFPPDAAPAGRSVP